MIVTEYKILLMCPGAKKEFSSAIGLNWDSLSIKYNITDSKYIPYFIAQIAHESGYLTKNEENLNYSVSGLFNTFSSSRISPADVFKYGRVDSKELIKYPLLKIQSANKEMIGNIIYGGKFGKEQLGNTEVGDGWKYRGGGFIQLTGKANYTSFANHMKMSVEQVSEYVRTPKGSLESSMWFWYNRIKANSIIDNGIDTYEVVKQLTAKINGGYKGLDERVNLTIIAKTIFL